MTDNAGAYLIFNGKLQKTDEFDESAKTDSGKESSSKNGSKPGGGESGKVYEVIRIIDRVPLFMEEHYERMQESMRLLGYKLETRRQEIIEHIRKLAEVNGIDSFNVKVTAAAYPDRQDIMVYVIKHYYPSRDEIELGVPVSLFKRVRENPNIKIINTDYKEAVARKMQEDQVFEVLLVNEKNEITEGSRSNAFFIKGNKVYTAPGEQVLKGITRRYIIDTCTKLGYEVAESPVPLAFLEEMDGMFISGTSIKVQPVSSIGGNKGLRQYASSTNPVIIAIRDGFDKLLEDYVNSRKI